MANSNNDIANKIFTYVRHGADITQQVKDIYNASLIFIGDEQQIYVPVIDTYVGVGKSKYDEIANAILWVPGEGTYSITTKYGNNRSLGTYSVSFGEKIELLVLILYPLVKKQLLSEKNQFQKENIQKLLEMLLMLKEIVLFHMEIILMRKDLQHIQLVEVLMQKVHLLMHMELIHMQKVLLLIL